MLRRPWLVLPLVSAFALSTPLAIGWPEKPIRLVVTDPDGVVSDSVARAIAAPLSRALGQPVLVDHQTGASGTVGGLKVVRSAPDGYTLLLSSAFSVGACLTPKVPCDPVRSLTHVAMLGIAPGLNERYFGISGPAGMPAVVTERLASALDDVLAEPAVVRRFTELGIMPRKATSAAFTAFVARQADRQPALVVAELPL